LEIFWGKGTGGHTRGGNVGEVEGGDVEGMGMRNSQKGETSSGKEGKKAKREELQKKAFRTLKGVGSNGRVREPT